MLSLDARTDRSIQIRRVLGGLLLANVAVVIVKAAIALGTGSLAVVGDAVHSSVDALNNVLGLVVIRVAARGPDEDHPYGHSKFETLGALAIVVFLSVSAFEIVKGAITRLVAGPETLEIRGVHIALLVLTLFVNAIVAMYETRRGHELDSQLLLADAAHTRADVFVTIGVLTGLLLSYFGLAWADAIVALGVAVVIAVVAYGIIARSIPVLVDEYVEPQDRIQNAAENVQGVAHAYAIRSRGSHDDRFAELTIAVDGTATVEAGHAIADHVEARLRSELGLHEVIVHVEPC
jgi:cation diffusion facilitator family transporter